MTQRTTQGNGRQSASTTLDHAHVSGPGKRVMTIRTPLGKDKLILRKFTLSEQLGRPFRIEADLLSKDTNIEFDKLVGEAVSISVELPGGKVRHLHGVVATFSLGDPFGVYAGYRAIIVPWIWFLTRTTDCRIFQDKTIPDIIKAVFKEYGFSDVVDHLKASYKPWVYCVQYRETDFNFVSRLMEQEGIYYFWRHSADKHEIVLVDDLTSHIPSEGYEKIPFRPEQPGYSGGEHISRWNVRQQLQPGIYALTDFNFEKPGASLQAKASASTQRLGSKWEIFDYPGEYEEQSEGETYARLRIQELQSQHEIVNATTDARGIEVGSQFELERHPRQDQNRAWLITASDYTFADGQHESGEAGEFTIHCAFQAIDAQQQFRLPRVTPKPVVQGPQTAIIVGPKGEEIYVDDFGRVKVKFHWDRYSKADQNSSCWIRASHPWAGQGFGGMSIPRIGQEVIVEFLEGDPDQPIINGRIYNASSMPHASNAGRDGKPGNSKPSGLKAAAMMTSLKSNSLGGSGGHNEITMNDAGGAEGLFIKAQKDEIHNVGNDRERTVGNNETVKIGANRTEKVGANESIDVAANRTRTVGQNETITVALMRTHTVGVNEAITVGVAQEITVGAAQTITVGAVQAITVGANQDTTVGASQSNSVGKDRTTSIGKDDALTVGKKLTISAGDEITIKTGDASISMKKDGTIVIKGKDITVKGSGDVVIKGKKIAAN